MPLDEDLAAWLRLSLTPGLGGEGLRRLLAAFGEPLQTIAASRALAPWTSPSPRSGPSEGSVQVYIIDVIGGHCGSDPFPVWNDVTQVTYENNTIGRWTGRGRF